MSSSSYWPKPPWFDENTTEADRIRWLLRLAVVCTEDNNTRTLAKRLGVSKHVVYLAISRGTVTDDLAKRIEKLYGRKYFPRELFIPEPELPGE